MSRGGRRGSPPDLKGTLGTLIRTTIDQVGAMTEVARRQARTQKSRLDTALLDRRRRDALADLGEALYDLATGGEIELDELPELAERVEDVAAIDREIAEADGGGADRGRRPVRLRPTAGSPQGGPRDRVADAFRERVGGALREGGERVGEALRERMGEGLGERVGGAIRDRMSDALRDRRPAASRGPTGSATQAHGEAHGDAPGEARGESPGDAVSSADWSARRRPDPHPGAAQRVWRPSLDDVPDPPAPRERVTERIDRDELAATARPATRADDRGGGIVFVDDDPASPELDPDDSLEAYMNDDDVPPRR
jgi:hypothetical protein